MAELGIESADEARLASLPIALLLAALHTPMGEKNCESSSL
jgi:hypothetical protein